MQNENDITKMMILLLSIDKHISHVLFIFFPVKKKQDYECLADLRVKNDNFQAVR